VKRETRGVKREAAKKPGFSVMQSYEKADSVSQAVHCPIEPLKNLVSSVES
jgi:hypothetical protein